MLNFRKSSSVNETEFMKPQTAARRNKPHKFAMITLLVIGSLILSFLVWASFAKLDVVTRGTGHVIPIQKTQVISNLEGGIIKEVLVKEGQIVDASQVLIRLEPKVAEAHFKARREQYLRYLAATSRLEAQLDGKDYHVPEEVKKELPTVAAEEITHYLERMKQLETQQSIAKQVIAEKNKKLLNQKKKLHSYKNNLNFHNKN